MAATFKQTRARAWTDGTRTIILPCDKKTFRLYATQETFLAAPIGRFRTLESAIRAVNKSA